LMLKRGKQVIKEQIVGLYCIRVWFKQSITNKSNDKLCLHLFLIIFSINSDLIQSKLLLKKISTKYWIEFIFKLWNEVIIVWKKGFISFYKIVIK
jgi:hypothetical protein